MATFHFELVSPEKLTYVGEVDQVDVPGLEGDFGVLADHAPLVATLRPGILVAVVGGKREKFVVLGGVAQMSANRLTVLADVATTLAEVDRQALADRIEEMEEKLKNGEPGHELDREIERLDHFKSLRGHLGTTAMH
jgi:F-type H+-transporting ATPase subunit epsilon